jgi:hypothetical protein
MLRAFIPASSTAAAAAASSQTFAALFRSSTGKCVSALEVVSGRRGLLARRRMAIISSSFPFRQLATISTPRLAEIAVSPIIAALRQRLRINVSVKFHMNKLLAALVVTWQLASWMNLAGWLVRLLQMAAWSVGYCLASSRNMQL